MFQRTRLTQLARCHYSISSGPQEVMNELELHIVDDDDDGDEGDHDDDNGNAGGDDDDGDD